MELEAHPEWTPLPPIEVTNTLGRRRERFEPLTPGLVRMYTCGPTVYDYTHLGHARTYVAFDAIKRYLVVRGYTVIHVQNITDIDDKIIDRARREGREWREVAEEYTRDYLEQLRKLRVLVDVHPRVTEHIREIIDFIQLLIEKGYAYVAPSGSVYFEVDKYPYYGELSGRRSPEQWRQEEEVVREKKKPYDFALWKAWKPGEPYWEAPWGKGRPGWHIECSVMSTRYLGKQFDIHGGGQDLIFPHHENEKAQSEAALGVRPWVRYWLHTGYLTIRGEKMSKSLGNIIPLREALSRWSPDELRMWLLSAHYRTQLDFTEEAMEQAKAKIRRIRGAIDETRRVLSEAEPRGRLSSGEARIVSEAYKLHASFHEAMSSDFNTPKAVAAVMEATSLVYREVAPRELYEAAAVLMKLFSDFTRTFGVLEEAVYGAAAAGGVDYTKLVDLLVKVRSVLRSRRDYELADLIREELRKLGIRLYDYPGGVTRWRLED